MVVAQVITCPHCGEDALAGSHRLNTMGSLDAFIAMNLLTALPPRSEASVLLRNQELLGAGKAASVACTDERRSWMGREG